MREPTLEFIVKLSEHDDPLETGITLIVGGLLVSGYVISKEKYMQHNPLTESIEKAFQEVLSEASEEERPKDDGKRRFIHLRDAKYFVPGQAPIPTTGSAVVRFRISMVAGFHLGTLSNTPAP